VTLSVRHDPRFVNFSRNLGVGDSIPLAILLYWEKSRCGNEGTLTKLYAEDLISRFTEFMTTPFYTKAELSEFHGNANVIGAEKTQSTILKAIEKLKSSNYLDALPFGDGCEATWKPLFEPDFLLKLYTMVTSRTFGVLVKNREISDIYCMPIIDLVNTEPRPNSNIQILGSNDLFSLVTDKAIPMGTEITIDYPSSGNYMYHYGFCMDNNTHSEYKFLIYHHLQSMVNDLVSHEERKAFLDELEENKHVYTKIMLSRNSSVTDLEQYVINFIKALQSGDRMKSLRNLDRIHEDFSFKDEKAMFQGLKKLFKLIANKYKTNIEQDQLLIARGIPNYKIYCATIIRRDEKMIIKTILQQLDVEEKNVNTFVSKVARSKLPPFLKPFRLFGKDKDYFLWRKNAFLHEEVTRGKLDRYLKIKWFATLKFPTLQEIQNVIRDVQSTKDSPRQGNIPQYSYKIHMGTYGDFTISDLKLNGENYWYVGLSKNQK
jgi:hypothetical protein